MYGIFTKIYPKNNPNVGKYTIHRASGYHSPNTITTIISFSNAKNYSHDPQITRNYSHPSEKYEFVSWGDEIPNMEKNKKMMNQLKFHMIGNKIVGQMKFQIWPNSKPPTTIPCDQALPLLGPQTTKEFTALKRMYPNPIQNSIS